MKKELIQAKLSLAEARSTGVEILAPGALTADNTAQNLVKLLQAVYVEHGITKNVPSLIRDIEDNKVKTWFAKKGDEFVATTSLVRQGDESWELGRAVSVCTGQSIGTRLMLQAALLHLSQHDGNPLIAEVRVADEHQGVPGSMATQRICLNTLGLWPHALAPLFGHGNPFRHETFALSASNLVPVKTISQRIEEAICSREADGETTRLRMLQNAPFRLILPDSQGRSAQEVIVESSQENTCSLFVVEATDQNLPLINTLRNDPDVITCGLDKSLGKNGRPILLFTTFAAGMSVAPTRISEDILNREMRIDMQSIANKFTQRGGLR